MRAFLLDNAPCSIFGEYEGKRMNIFGGGVLSVVEGRSAEKGGVAMARLKRLFRVAGCVVRNWKIFSYRLRVTFREIGSIVDMAVTLEDESNQEVV